MEDFGENSPIGLRNIGMMARDSI
jgi:hypothetical protein